MSISAVSDSCPLTAFALLYAILFRIGQSLVGLGPIKASTFQKIRGKEGLRSVAEPLACPIEHLTQMHSLEL